jgi:hypothetical protein
MKVVITEWVCRPRTLGKIGRFYYTIAWMLIAVAADRWIQRPGDVWDHLAHLPIVDLTIAAFALTMAGVFQFLAFHTTMNIVRRAVKQSRASLEAEDNSRA